VPGSGVGRPPGRGNGEEGSLNQYGDTTAGFKTPKGGLTSREEPAVLVTERWELEFDFEL